MYAVDYSNYLQHHGILGMKWGVRRYQNADGSLTSAGKRRYNENYNPDQIRRDIAVYGKHGAKRISKDMDRGIPISGARSLEADRFHKAEKASRTGRKVGKVVGLVAGFAGGAALGALTVKAIKEGKIKPFSKMKLTNRMQMQQGINFLKTEQGSAIVKAGAIALGTMLGMGAGAAIGKNAPLVAKGYTSLAKHNVKVSLPTRNVKVSYTEKKRRSERDKLADKEWEKQQKKFQKEQDKIDKQFEKEFAKYFKKEHGMTEKEYIEKRWGMTEEEFLKRAINNTLPKPRKV